MIRAVTTGCAGLLALIAETAYLHMRALVELRGQPGWVAAPTLLSVDGMIVAASTTLVADSRAGERGGRLPWALLGQVVRRAWPQRCGGSANCRRAGHRGPAVFALIGVFELLMRQIRRGAAGRGRLQRSSSDAGSGKG